MNHQSTRRYVRLFSYMMCASLLVDQQRNWNAGYHLAAMNYLSYIQVGFHPLSRCTQSLGLVAWVNHHQLPIAGRKHGYEALDWYGELCLKI